MVEYLCEIEKFNVVKKTKRGVTMAEEKWIISGYEFATKGDYEKAKKEAESVMYIKAHTDMTDTQQVLKIYNKASDMKMFQTVVGYEFMHQLYAILVKKKVMEPEYLKTIPVCKQAKERDLPEDVESANRLSEQYRVLYEDSKEKRKQQKIIIVFLILLIGAMVAMVYFNYNTYDENEVLDKYSTWEAELEEREAALKEKEEALGISDVQEEVEEVQEQ